MGGFIDLIYILYVPLGASLLSFLRLWGREAYPIQLLSLCRSTDFGYPSLLSSITLVSLDSAIDPIEKN